MKTLKDPKILKLGDASSTLMIYQNCQKIHQSWNCSLQETAQMTGIQEIVETPRDLLLAIAENHSPEMFCRSSDLKSIHHILKTNFPKTKDHQKYLEEKNLIYNLSHSSSDEILNIFRKMMKSFKNPGITYISKERPEL